MADSAKRLVGPVALAIAEATLYTVPAATSAILKFITVANSDLSSQEVYLSIGADAVGTRLLPGVRVPGQTAMDVPTWVVLASGETLRGRASAAGALAISISGVEVS